MLRNLLSRVEKLEAEGRAEGPRLLWANLGESLEDCRARYQRETGGSTSGPALIVRWDEE